MQASPEEVLAGYQRTSKPTTPGVKQRLKLGVESVKNRARAMKLRHDIKNLQTAIDGQHESLGTLTLQHHPKEVDINTETAELSQVQENLGQKQATRQTLHETKGSSSVVKELDSELEKLRDRQRELMIAIGRKAEVAKADIPGAAGHYSGIEQLRSSLAARESEVTSLEEQFGPALEGQGPRWASLKKPLIIGGAVLVSIVVLWLLWKVGHAILSGDEIDFRYVPDDAIGIVYVDVEKLRGTDLPEYFEDVFPEAMQEMRRLPVELQLEDVEDFLTVMISNEDGIRVVRTYEDLPLDEIVSDGRDDVRILDYKDTEYADISDFGYLAKTGKRVYCMTDDKKDIERTINRLQRGEKGELSELLQTALDLVRSEDHYLAMEVQTFTGSMPYSWAQESVPGLKSVGIGASVDSSALSVSGALVFRRAHYAEDFADEYEDFLEEYERTLIRAMRYETSETQEAFEDLLEMLRGLDVKQSGETVRFQGSWELSEVERLVTQFGEKGGF